MNRHMSVHEFVGVGLYSVADAAQLLKAPPRTLRRWLDGYASGVPTIVLAESVKAEGSVSRVAAMYEVEKSVVQDAVRFHEELMAA